MIPFFVPVVVRGGLCAPLNFWLFKIFDIQSALEKSAIANLQSAIANLQSSIPNPQNIHTGSSTTRKFSSKASIHSTSSFESEKSKMSKFSFSLFLFEDFGMVEMP